MRLIIFCAFLGLALGASVQRLPVRYKADISSTAILASKSELARAVGPQDWLTDLISQLLGISVTDLLILINDTFIGMEALVEQAVAALQAIFASVSPAAQEKLRAAISKVIELLATMEPFQVQLSKVLPAITKEIITIMDLVSDIIEAILQITLEQLLNSVTESLVELNKLLTETMAELKAIALDVAEAVAKEIEVVLDTLLEEAQVLLRPLFDMMNQIFPQFTLVQLTVVKSS